MKRILTGKQQKITRRVLLVLVFLCVLVGATLWVTVKTPQWYCEEKYRFESLGCRLLLSNDSLQVALPFDRAQCARLPQQGVFLSQCLMGVQEVLEQKSLAARLFDTFVRLRLAWSYRALARMLAN